MKYAIVCGDYTSAIYDLLQDAMDYVDSNLNQIREEGGRNYPIQITNCKGDIIAERGYISVTELADWDIS